MKAVIKGTGYVLVHTPDMVMQNGTTQTTEKIVNPDSDYLKEVPKHLRSYEDAVAYLPNQVYIGGASPDDLKGLETPFDKPVKGAKRFAKFGEIMPEDEFMLLVSASDEFDVVKLDNKFIDGVKKKFGENEIIDESIVNRINEGVDASEVDDLVKNDHAEPLFVDGKLIGCVKPAHDIDVNLSAHVMHENLMSKASSVLALLYAVKDAGVEKAEVDYVIDCAEEACGDMNQRGGGNFAKAAAEIAGLVNATGSDTRGFCAAPSHSIIEAASYVAAGTYKTVVVTAGGCTAKLGMNGKNHVEKGLPIYEDCLGGFAVVISANDGKNPEVNLEILGKHSVGTGSSPQAVIGSLVLNPLEKNGMKILDIDKYAPEMQNPDITKPAGAGDVPLANYKMIGALAAKNGEIKPPELTKFVEDHGLIGWAPTQGHIPSGVPYIGFARQDILDGKIKNAMIIGKGSLFLGRMTNLFDGVSFVIQANSGEAGGDSSVSEDQVKGLIAEAMKDLAANITKQSKKK